MWVARTAAKFKHIKCCAQHLSTWNNPTRLTWLHMLLLFQRIMDARTKHGEKKVFLFCANIKCWIYTNSFNYLNIHPQLFAMESLVQAKARHFPSLVKISQPENEKTPFCHSETKIREILILIFNDNQIFILQDFGPF